MVNQLARLDIARREPSTEVARALIEYIFSGKLGPGSRLPSERELAESFGTGRSVVREALKSLGLLGLVEIRQGDGTYLRGADSELLPKVIEWGLLLGEQRTIDLVEARQHIEIVVAGLAAERRSAADLRDIRICLQRMQRAKQAKAYVLADVAFHLRVAEASQNTILSSMLNSVQSLLHVWIRRVIEAGGDTQRSYAEHATIFEAIERQDSAAATAAMAFHMDGAAGRLMAALEEHAATQLPTERDQIPHHIRRTRRVGTG